MYEFFTDKSQKCIACGGQSNRNVNYRYSTILLDISRLVTGNILQKSKSWRCKAVTYSTGSNLAVNVSASWPAVKEVDDSPSRGHKSSLQKLTRSLRSFGLSRLSDSHIAFSDLPGRVRACKRKRYIIQHYEKKSTMVTDHCCCRHNF